MRIALGIEYDGANFSGWQHQHGLRTVEGVVTDAIARVANQPIKLHCAGRTDAGVHANEQIVHFDTAAQRELDAWLLGGNANLPGDVAIKWSRIVDSDFHARFTAISRRYQYFIFANLTRPAVKRQYVTWVPISKQCARQGGLNWQAMHDAAQCLIGEHDFSSFRAADCQSNSPCRNIINLTIVSREDGLIVVDIKANAFLHHMVRNIVGSLIPIGRGVKDAQWLQDVLNARDRKKAGPTAPASGLFLYQVEYPKHFNLFD
jgi:tRNA pseudouridine38-40 synthase